MGGSGGGDGYGGGAGGLKLAQLRHITRPDRCLPACLCAYVYVQMRVPAYVRVSCTLRPFSTALAPPVLVAAAVVSKSEVPQAARSLSSGHRDARLAQAAGRTPQIEKGGGPPANCFTTYQTGAFHGEAGGLAGHHQPVETGQCFVFVLFPLFVCLCHGFCIFASFFFLREGPFVFWGLNYLHILAAWEDCAHIQLILEHNRLYRDYMK